MTSSSTNDPILPAPVDCPLSVEYTLSLADHHALDMFVYDRFIRKRARFQLEFYGVNLLVGAGLAAILGLLLWGFLKALGSTVPPTDPHVPLRMGYGGALLMFSIILIGMVPGSFLHRITRSKNDKRFWEARLAQLRAGILRYPQRYRVVLTPEGFTETVEFRETGVAVEITERKETRVWWAAVTSIDVAGKHAFFHAFFTVQNKGYLVLPRTAFADEESFRLFVDMAKSYREAARVMPAPRLELSVPQDTRITR